MKWRKRFFPNGDLAVRSKLCRWCTPKDIPGILHVQAATVDVWVCREHTDNALDEVIRHWNEVK